MFETPGTIPEPSSMLVFFDNFLRPKTSSREPCLFDKMFFFFSFNSIFKWNVKKLWENLQMVFSTISRYLLQFLLERKAVFPMRWKILWTVWKTLIQGRPAQIFHWLLALKKITNWINFFDKVSGKCSNFKLSEISVIFWPMFGRSCRKHLTLKIFR